MELIPIFYTTFLISLGLLVVVLVYSRFFAHKQKEEIKENYKEIVNQRRMAHSREQMEYIRKMMNSEGYSDRSNNYQEEPGNNASSKTQIEEKRSNPEKAGSKTSNDYFHPEKYRRNNNGQRFSIMNDTFTDDKELKSSKDNKSFYPVN